MLRLDESVDRFVEIDGKLRRVALDMPSGKYFAKLAEVVPSADDDDPQRKRFRDAVMSKSPQHYSSTRADFTGYWMEVGDDPGADQGKPAPGEQDRTQQQQQQQQQQAEQQQAE